MEPNQNINTVQNASSAPTTAGVPSVPSTPSTASNASVGSSKPGSDVVFQDKSKKGHGMLYGMILLAILAAGGIGFGVWAMMDGNDRQANFDKQIADLKSQNNESCEELEKQDGGTLQPELQDNEFNEENESGSTLPSLDSDENEKNDAKRYSWAEDNDVRVDYIYIGGWGVKIKVPESLSSSIDYMLAGGDKLEILDTGRSIGYLGVQIDWKETNILMIWRSKKGSIDFEGCMVSCSTYITTIGDYDYSYMMQGSNLELLRSTPLREMVKEEAFSTF